MNKQFEWADDTISMVTALRALNKVLLETTNLEETALIEARIVKLRLENLDDLTRSELVDYLKQAAIDVLVSFNRYERTINE